MLGNIGNRSVFLGHLFDRFDLELFGIAPTVHGDYVGLIMRFEDDYETKGDSFKNRLLRIQEPSCSRIPR